MTIIKEIDLAIYPYYVYVLCTDDHSSILPAINRHLKAHHEKFPPFEPSQIAPQDSYTAFIARDENIAYIVLTYRPNAAKGNDLTICHVLARVLAHEVTHIISEWMHFTGVRWDRENDEPIAYPLGYITGKAVQIFHAFLYKIKVEVKL